MWSNFNKDNYDYFLIIDVEATCSNDNQFPRTEMEIIEIGAVVVDGGSYEVLGEFCQFIQPTLHPILTEFCKELTTIQQSDVDNGVSYPEAIVALEKFVRKVVPNGQGLFCSWGAFDKNQFKSDSTLHQRAYPFNEEHLNLKTTLSLNQGRKKQYGLAKAMSVCGIPQTGTHHRGIDDARNMAKLMPFVLGDKKIK